MVELTVLDARCYVCGHLISGPVTIHTDRGQAHPSCVNCSPAAESEIATLRARVEELEKERDELREADGNFWAAVARAEAAESRLSEATRLAVAALEPFASTSSEYIRSATTPDHGLCAATSFTAGDFRRARTALDRLNAMKGESDE